jgi:hypothetical protein
MNPALLTLTFGVLSLPALVACSDDELAGNGETATVSLHNDFDNTEFDRQPPWTICEASFRGTEFGMIGIGDTSEEQPVEAGLDHVLLVAAWADPGCAIENALPVASRYEEEVVPGQTRVISINVPNHQGPCPPEGVQPIPEDLYNRILARWPEYDFLPYAERTENPQCLE